MYSMPIRRALGASLQALTFTNQRDRAPHKDWPLNVLSKWAERQALFNMTRQS